jgi:hypothetical protein
VSLSDMLAAERVAERVVKGEQTVGGDFLEVASASVVSGTPTAVYDSQGTTRGQVDHQESGANVVSHKGRVSAGTEKAAETQIHRDRRQLSIHERVP